jgi:hypothetical protein
VRVMFDGAEPTFAGKTNDAQMPPHLLRMLASTFTQEKMIEAFPEAATSVCLYGEGYGAKIQKGGGRYIPTGCGFILFDVKIGDWWLEDAAVFDIAMKLGVKMVPPVIVGSLAEIIEWARRGFKSEVATDATYDAEGLVMKPTTPLFNRRGERVIAKIKAKDFVRPVVGAERSTA